MASIVSISSHTPLSAAKFSVKEFQLIGKVKLPLARISGHTRITIGYFALIKWDSSLPMSVDDHRQAIPIPCKRIVKFDAMIPWSELMEAVLIEITVYIRKPIT